MVTGYEVEMFHNIGRIATALERIATALETQATTNDEECEG